MQEPIGSPVCGNWHAPEQQSESWVQKAALAAQAQAPSRHAPLAQSSSVTHWPPVRLKSHAVMPWLLQIPLQHAALEEQLSATPLQAQTWSGVQTPMQQSAVVSQASPTCAWQALAVTHWPASHVPGAQQSASLSQR